ncbi:MAG TPA: hypothetical protein VG826_04395 [Pirellulales bacterium]|nr:hypothetical protein [Pirellulales bacterium]
MVLATDTEGRRVFEVRGLDSNEVPPIDEIGHRFAAYAVFDAQVTAPPPLAGHYSVDDGSIRFTPRFPLQPGMRYRAVYRDAGEESDQTVLSKEFVIPARVVSAAARVAAIYPTTSTLPENQLKFYIQFTAPMSRGGAYEHLRLLDAEGQPVDLPFLELAEELWNPAGDRLTLLLDPGRVKQGLKPREEVGPVLAEGRRFTLVVDRRWPDAAGQPLAGELRKAFRVAAADDTCPKPRAWRLNIPRAGSRLPLVVDFGEPLDYALLQRMLWIVDRRGEPVPGSIEVGEEETSWRFLPQQPWRPAKYRLVADTLLEDLAGNSIARKFELDARQAGNGTAEQETASVEFQVRE